MVYFPESSIIITKDGLYCQVYSNEHPEGYIIVKPKYIPTTKISGISLPSRFIGGKKVNRLDLWTNVDALKKYIDDFSRHYPQYILKNSMYEKSPLFFAVSESNVDKVYFPRDGLKELMDMPKIDLDSHLESVVGLVSFLLKSGLKLSDLGLTYSTLMGHYSPEKSDINIVVYGKDNYWKLMKFLTNNKDKDLEWKSYEQWESHYRKRHRVMIEDKEIYINNMYRKKSEGFFRKTLFVIFAAEEPDDVWFKWGEERYKSLGIATISGRVVDHYNSCVRPGLYEITDSKIISGERSEDIEIKKVVFYSRDYSGIVYSGESIEASGLLEEVTPKYGEKYYRLVVGYFDTYLSERRGKEYIKIVS